MTQITSRTEKTSVDRIRLTRTAKFVLARLAGGDARESASRPTPSSSAETSITRKPPIEISCRQYRNHPDFAPAMNAPCARRAEAAHTFPRCQIRHVPAVFDPSPSPPRHFVRLLSGNSATGSRAPPIPPWSRLDGEGCTPGTLPRWRLSFHPQYWGSAREGGSGTRSSIEERPGSLALVASRPCTPCSPAVSVSQTFAGSPRVLAAERTRCNLARPFWCWSSGQSGVYDLLSTG